MYINNKNDNSHTLNIIATIITTAGLLIELTNYAEVYKESIRKKKKQR